MLTLILKRSSPQTTRHAFAALTAADSLLRHYFSTAAISTPINGGLSREKSSIGILTSAFNEKREFFHVKPGPLSFEASLASKAQFAVDDYGLDEEKASGGGSEEGLEIAKLGISQEIISALASRGITKLFPIQKAVLEPAMQGRDLFGRARTGTGKTLAFGIPIIDKIIQFNAKHGRGRNPLALVMAPTRELARQVEKEFSSSASSIDTICLYGGTPISRQMRELDYGVDVVVGTPGRIIDLMRRGSLNLSEVQFVVLDEADQMLSVGFVEDIKTIFERLPQNRHNMLFSATMPSWIRNLVREHLKDPLTIDLVGDSDKKLADGITLYSIVSEMYSKASILGPLITDHAKGGKCIIFTERKRDADKLAYAMARNFRCEALHGDISQAQRERTLAGFRDGNFNILVATDVAARGLDVPNVDLVIHYALPNSSETFVHRSGRTGRAGKKGTAILIYSQDEYRQVRIFERDIGCRFTELPRINADGGGMEMLNDTGGGRFSSFGGRRDRQFGDKGFGRSGGPGEYGSNNFGGSRTSGFSRSDGYGGQFSSRTGYNRQQPGNFSGSGFGGSSRQDRTSSSGDFGSSRASHTGGFFGDSGRSTRSSSFGNFGSGRPSGFGDSSSGQTSGTGGFFSESGRSSRSSSFGDFDESNPAGRRNF